MATLQRYQDPNTGEWVDQGPQVEDSSSYQDPWAGYTNPTYTPQPAWAPPATANWSPGVGNPGGPSWAGEHGPAPTTTAAPKAPSAFSYDLNAADQEAFFKDFLSSHGGDPNKSPYWMTKTKLGWDVPYLMQKLGNDESITGDHTPSGGGMGSNPFDISSIIQMLSGGSNSSAGGGSVGGSSQQGGGASSLPPMQFGEGLAPTGWVQVAGGWVAPDNPLAHGGTAGTLTGDNHVNVDNKTTPGPTEHQDFRQILDQIINSAGRPNTAALNLRIEGARENMDRTRKSQMDSLLASLSDRGTLGSGTEVTGGGLIEQGLADTYGQQVNQITADEYNRADARMMSALGLLTGMDTASLDRAVKQYEAETGRQVGLGNVQNAANANEIEKQLGLGRLSNEANSNDITKLLGLGNLALGNARLGADYSLGLGGLQQGQNNGLLDLVRILSGNSGNSNQGYI